MKKNGKGFQLCSKNSSVECIKNNRRSKWYGIILLKFNGEPRIFRKN